MAFRTEIFNVFNGAYFGLPVRTIGNSGFGSSVNTLTPLLVLLALRPNPKGWIPIVVDQTTIRGTPTLMAGVRVSNRVLPVAFSCFEYDKLRKSQNAAEEALFTLIAPSLPSSVSPFMSRAVVFTRTP